MRNEESVRRGSRSERRSHKAGKYPSSVLEPRVRDAHIRATHDSSKGEEEEEVEEKEEDGKRRECR